MHNEKNIAKIIDEIIPLNDYLNRYEFNNTHLIDCLTLHEIQLIEPILIQKLKKSPDDTLIVDTLVYIKSKNALPIFYEIIGTLTNNVKIIIMASSIYKLCQDKEMIGIAIDAFRKISDSFDIITAFYYLVTFNDSIANDLVKTYTENEDVLVSYNAKRALGLFEPS